MTISCPECHGEGEVALFTSCCPCEVCKGSGQVERKDALVMKGCCIGPADKWSFQSGMYIPLTDVLSIGSDFEDYWLVAWIEAEGKGDVAVFDCKNHVQLDLSRSIEFPDRTAFSVFGALKADRGIDLRVRGNVEVYGYRMVALPM